MAEGGGCRIPLAMLPDGVLALVLSFGTVSGLVAASQVCQAWVMRGNRIDLWTSLGKAFEVAMPVSLGPQAGVRAGGVPGAGRQKRALRCTCSLFQSVGPPFSPSPSLSFSFSVVGVCFTTAAESWSGSNAKRTFLKSWAAAVKTDRLKHDATLSEAYTLFRMQDSVVRLRTLLRRRWGIIFRASSKLSSSSNSRRGSSSSNNNNCNNSVKKNSEETAPPSSPSSLTSAVAAGSNNSKEAGTYNTAIGGSAADSWRESGSVRWTFDVNHRHGIFEGNTLLNFAAVRCGRKKCVEFILWRMRADPEIPDYGGFTPLLNTAWRGDLPLLKQLLAAGARLDVEGVSRGVGPYGPLEWAERKNRPVTAAFLRSLSAKEAGGGGGGGGGGEDGVRKAESEGDASQTDVRVDAP
ncbi:unnamed protein product [Pylaiella littoralis]